MYEVKLYFNEEEIKREIEEYRKRFFDGSIEEELPLIVDNYVEWVETMVKEIWHKSKATQQMEEIFKKVVDKYHYV